MDIAITPPPGRQEAEDGSEVKLRQEIWEQILSGRVDDAIALLNTHFPFILSESVVPTAPQKERPRPSSLNDNLEYVSSTSTESAHLLLNLCILACSEACRTIPLESPSKSGTAHPSSNNAVSATIPEPEETPDYPQQQVALLTRVQKLYAFCHTLPDPQDRAIYLKEVENVGGLLAYRVPEKSPMAKYLSMERREAVADQINRAILKRTGRPH